MKTKLREKRLLTNVFIIVMIAIFIINLILSTQCNRFWVAVSGGGYLTEHLQLSRADILGARQLYRLISYGFLQTSIIHLLANVIALWYIGGFFEKYFGRLKFLIVFVIGLIIPGALFLLIYPNAHIYGASPAIFACIGILIGRVLRHKELWQFLKRQNGFRFIAWYFFLGNLPGMCTLVFHLLGFATGLLMSQWGRFSLTQDAESERTVPGDSKKVGYD